MFVRQQELHFSATHVITGLPSWHPCARMHGHNYVARIRLETDDPLGEDGRVGGDALTELEQWIEETLNHTHLNQALPDLNRASVNDIAEWIVEIWKDRLPELVSVHLYETSKTSALVTVER
jgi:6-pyruvoyltetrahydropterin/6-carboxytetrahydropterin synthase